MKRRCFLNRNKGKEKTELRVEFLQGNATETGKNMSVSIFIYPEENIRNSTRICEHQGWAASIMSTMTSRQ